MPHGLTIDHEGNTWLTDVAMHQVRTQFSLCMDVTYTKNRSFLGYYELETVKNCLK